MRDQDHFQICIFGTQPQGGPNWLISLIGEVKEQSTKFMSRYLTFCTCMVANILHMANAN